MKIEDINFLKEKTAFAYSMDGFEFATTDFEYKWNSKTGKLYCINDGYGEPELLVENIWTIDQLRETYEVLDFGNEFYIDWENEY